jgi:hypothetical protein
MRKLITTIALLALVDGSAAIAQPAGPRNPGAPPSMNSHQQMLLEAPVAHHQPRADQVPSEKNLMNPNDPVNQENAPLDRMTNGICRGCWYRLPHLIARPTSASELPFDCMLALPSGIAARLGIDRAGPAESWRKSQGDLA